MNENIVRGLRIKMPEILRASDLVWAWTARTIRGRYQQSLLGWLWAVIQPLATVAIFTIVFTRFVRVETNDVPYILFSYVAVAPWTFFAMSLTDMSMSLVQNMNLVTKIYFPREVLPIAAMLARFLDFAISSVIVGFLLLFYRFYPSLPGLAMLLAVLLIQVLLTIGLGLLTSAANVFYRDVDPLLRLGIQLWFYASPIIYPVALVPEQYRNLYYLNPMAGIIEAYRDVLIYGKLPGEYLLPAAGVSLGMFLFGYWVFKRTEPQFADIV